MNQPGHPALEPDRTGITATTTPPLVTTVKWVCDRTTSLTDSALGELLALGQSGMRPLQDADRWVRCALERHESGIPHVGLVMDPRSLAKSAIWLRWLDGSVYSALAVLPDCPAASPDGRDGCCEFEGHTGGHSWELADSAELQAELERPHDAG